MPLKLDIARDEETRETDESSKVITALIESGGSRLNREGLS